MTRPAALLLLVAAVTLAACGPGPDDVVEEMLDEAVAGRRVDDFWENEPTTHFPRLKSYAYVETLSDAAIEIERLDLATVAKEAAVPILEARRSEATEASLRGDGAAKLRAALVDRALALLREDIEAARNSKLGLIDRLHQPPMWLRYRLTFAPGVVPASRDYCFKVEKVHGAHRLTGGREPLGAGDAPAPDRVADEYVGKASAG